MSDSVAVSIDTWSWVNWAEETIKEELRLIQYHTYWLNASKEAFLNGDISQKRHMRACEYHKSKRRHHRERYRVCTRLNNLSTRDH